MSEPLPPTVAEPANARRGFRLHPLAQVFVCAVLGTTGEVLLKLGADRTAHLPSAFPWLGLTGLMSGWVWMSILFTILSFFSWMLAIRALPLGVAFTLANVVHVLIPLSCWAFLNETIHPQRWCGIILVVVGLLVIARPYARLDARL